MSKWMKRGKTCRRGHDAWSRRGKELRCAICADGDRRETPRVLPRKPERSVSQGLLAVVLRATSNIPLQPKEIHERLDLDHRVSSRSVLRALRHLFEAGKINWVPYSGYWRDSLVEPNTSGTYSQGYPLFHKS